MDLKIVDYSSLSCLAACPQKFDYAFNQRLTPIGSAKVPLFAGQVMAEGYNLLHTELKSLWAKDLDAAHKEVCYKLEDSWGAFVTPSTSKHSYLTLGHLEIVMYNYMRDRDPTQITPLADAGKVLAEKAVSFQWPLQTEFGVELQTVAGKPDMPCRVAGQNVIVDLKCTTGWVNEWWAKKFSTIGHQLRIYMAMLQQHYGIYVTAAYVDGVYMGEKAAEPDSYWKTVKSTRGKLFGPFNFTKSQLEETWQWVNNWNATRELFAEKGVWPQNEDHCSSYGGCEYATLCSRSPVVRESLKAREYVVWESDGILLSGADRDE